MNKSELVAEIAVRTGMKHKQVWQALNSLCEVVAERLQAGEDVWLPPLGKFRYVVRAPRHVRHPHTGEIMEVPEKATVTFLPSRTLKGRVN
ncbi:HU family DNA-binding protein [Alicyclobacillus acidocaldarius]|uniref:Histone family protein DNA-binding protein n=1 Tax=Alicyclobacillus acidocaldarius (strain Tc-4-1) TaxID=1048834 RepID=F8IL88_ALIAT|nr:HU family DNA-binding protein [Alicyclobacillus acidocaldarius]AEJ43654.1 histone family protein DNA-binding protein [Alicyclobacillus acidocaldarius subsp. acidocaldarius Tc-4-1]